MLLVTEIFQQQNVYVLAAEKDKNGHCKTIIVKNFTIK